MWANRITLDFIQHTDARITAANILIENGFTDEDIYELDIKTDSGYVYYKMILNDGQTFCILDDGDILT